MPVYPGAPKSAPEPLNVTIYSPTRTTVLGGLRVPYGARPPLPARRYHHGADSYACNGSLLESSQLILQLECVSGNSSSPRGRHHETCWAATLAVVRRSRPLEHGNSPWSMT